MAIILDVKQRENLAKIIADLGKIVFAAIVVGRFVSPEKITLIVFTLGLFLSLFCFICSIFIDREPPK